MLTECCLLCQPPPPLVKLLKSRRRPDTSAETSTNVVESSRQTQSHSGAGQSSTAPSQVMTFIITIIQLLSFSALTLLVGSFGTLNPTLLLLLLYSSSPSFSLLFASISLCLSLPMENISRVPCKNHLCDRNGQNTFLCMNDKIDNAVSFE